MQSRLERAERKGRQDIVRELEAELETPPLPPAVEYLWDIYRRLRSRKGGGLEGPSPLEWDDFHYFQAVTKSRLLPWEIRILEQLDDAYLVHESQEIEAMKGGKAAPDKPGDIRAMVKGLARRPGVNRD